MTCCIARPVRPIVFTAADVDKHQEFAEFDCECGSCCKRVALFAPRPRIVEADEWIVKVIADITFGCKKGFCFGGNVEVDFKNGVILDLMGDYVSVAYRVIEVINLNLEGAVIPSMSFGAMIACCGAGGARGCATRTTEQITLSAAANDALIPVPPFAYAVTFATSNPAGLFTSTTTFTQLGSGTTSVIASSAGDELPDPWLLAGGVRSINVNMPIVGEGTQTIEAVFLIGV